MSNESRRPEPPIESAAKEARDAALDEVLRRHHLLGKKFHNEAVVREVAAAVAASVLIAVQAAYRRS